MVCNAKQESLCITFQTWSLLISLKLRQQGIFNSIKIKVYVGGSIMGCIVSPPKIYWNLNHWYLWMWLYFGKRVFGHAFNLRWGHLGELKSKDDWCSQKKRKRHKRRISCDNRGREQHDAAAGWEISKVNDYHQKLGRGSAGLDPQSLRGSMSLLTPWAWTCHLWIYDRMNEFSSFAISQFVVLCYYGHVGKAMAPYSSTFAWKIPWMEEPGRL